MYGSYKPKRSDKALDYNLINELYDNNKKNLNIIFDPSYFFVSEDATGMWITLNPSTNPTDTMNPWQIYKSPSAMDATTGWRTVRVHSGTMNEYHAVKSITNTFSDDTDTFSNSVSNAVNMDMVLEAEKNYFICVYQTIQSNSLAITSTSIFFKEDKTPTENPFIAYPSHNVIHNIAYYVIGRIEVGKDSPTGDPLYHKLDIQQIISDNFTFDYHPLTFWEAANHSDNPLTTATTDDWKKWKIIQAGSLSPTLTISDITNEFTLTNGDTNHFYLKYTLDTDTGDATAAQLKCEIVPTQPSTPSPGLAPAFVTENICAVYVPTDPAPCAVAVEAPGETINYNAVTIGWDVNNTGDVVHLLAGIFY